MRERPIIFSAPMVRAILDGRKSQTRRVVKPQPEAWKCNDGETHYAGRMPDGTYHDVECDALRRFADTCPYGQPGDRLWVRETWGLHAYGDDSCWYTYSGAGKDASTLEDWALTYRSDWGPCQDGCRWRPSIHMPRWASRITLEIVGVRVERLQDISDDDLAAEGIQEIIDAGVDHDGTPRDAYRSLWESINGDGSWAANPWVWVVEFKRAA